MLRQSGTGSMSSLVRDILENRKIKVQIHDASLDNLAEVFLESKMEWKSGVSKLGQIQEILENSSLPLKLLWLPRVEQTCSELQKNLQNIERSMNPLLEKWLQK
jgi:hypothetical protein